MRRVSEVSTVIVNLVGIPYNTLKKDVTKDNGKCCLLGKSAGRMMLAADNEQQFVADMLAWKDPGNDSAIPSEAIDYVMEVTRTLTHCQAQMHLNRTLLSNHPDQVKPKPRVAQRTTTKQSGITISQQFHWHQTYEGCLEELVKRNTGICRLTGLTFKEVVHNFTAGGGKREHQVMKQLKGAHFAIMVMNKRSAESKHQYKL